SYESCDWSENEILNFIRDYGDQINPRVMAAESFNFKQGYTNPILTDTEAVDNCDIVAGHIYGGGLSPYPLAEQQNKEIWMTEYLMNLNTGNAGAPAWDTYTDEQIWNETMSMLNSINQAMSVNWNAYVWWYLKRYYSFLGDGTQGTVSGEILKRGVAFSHFSKYIRPGYVRVDLQAEQSTSLEMTAYKGDNRIVVVAINRNNQGVPNIALSVEGSSISSAKAYTSSLSLDRNMRELEIIDDAAIVSFTRSSVTTIVLEL
ncbi:MAG: glycoside hydrolase family 30 beta sandwich domain-containing protein, partial [Cyclobacteriaceae bacterium]